MAFNPLFVSAMSDVDNAESGLGSGLVNTSFTLGGAIGLAALVSLAASRTDSLENSGSEQLAALAGGYHAGLLVGALLAGTAAALAGFLLRFGAAPDQASQAEPSTEGA
jgi:hypothetical protein